jgi:hypothetical protein
MLFIRHNHIVYLLSIIVLLFFQTNIAAKSPEKRDSIFWPFKWNSIWNMPIGMNASYKYASIEPSTERGFFPEEDILILKINAPLKNIYRHDAGWDKNVKRCQSIVSPKRKIISNVPIPDTFATDPDYIGITPNHAAAILRRDGVTIEQTQPFHVCNPGGTAISQYKKRNGNIKTGEGLYGAHGGSGMSSLGGTIRVGELVPGSIIRHALKINIYAKKYIYFDANDDTPGYRWPASTADGYAGPDTYGGEIPELEMGSLLALKPNFDKTILETQPAKIIAQALIDYGGYVVDDTGWDVYSFATEWGPNGRVIDEFKEVWGFPIATRCTYNNKCYESQCSGPDCLEYKWAKDLANIFSNIYVVSNNSNLNRGGPGKRTTQCAPPFKDGSGAPPSNSVCSLPPIPSISATDHKKLITISLDPGSKKDQNADWWIASYNVSGWKSFVIHPESYGWEDGIKRCIEMPIVSLESVQIPSPPLSKGDNTIIFAVDDNADNKPDATWWDSVEVEVQ